MVNNLGYSDQLLLAIETKIKTRDIPILNSAAIVPPSDPRNYLPDSHFTDANDDLLAREMDRIIRRQLAKKSAA